MGIPGSPWWVVEESLGPPHMEMLQKHMFFLTSKGAWWSLEAPRRILEGLWAAIGVLGCSSGRPLEVLGEGRGVFWDPLGCLGGPYGAIGDL